MLEQKRKKEEELNSKLPSYDPKTAGKSSVLFGNDASDYHTKVRNPPGGKSNIQFG